MTGGEPRLAGPARLRRAELLDSVGPGRWLASAISLAVPEGLSAVLVGGDHESAGTLALALVDAGWTVLADRPSSVRWHADQLIAASRSSAFVTSARAARGRNCTPVRPGSTAVFVDVRRSSADVPVATIIRAMQRRPDEECLLELPGQQRFEQAALLLLGGALAPPAASPEEVASAHAGVARLPSLAIRFNEGEAEQAARAVREWWAAR